MALILLATMPLTAKSMDRGITMAVMIAARMFPQKEKENHDHKHRTLEEVHLHRINGLVHQ